MPYTNAGFTGNDGTETSGWDPVEVQHFKDLENTLVGDAVGSVKDTAGHKHNNFYDQVKTLAMQALTGAIQVKSGFSLVCNDTLVAEKTMYFNGPACLNSQKVASGTGATDTVDLAIYNSYSWRPVGTGTTARTLTLSNPVDGIVFRAVNASSCANLNVGPETITPGTAAIISYDNGVWYKI